MSSPSPHLALVLVCALFLAAAWRLAPAQDREVELLCRPVAGAVHWIEGRGGNIGISAGEDGALLVDDQFRELAPRIREEVLKLTGGAIAFVLNTHFHGDHTGGNPVFGETAPILAHHEVRRRLVSPRSGEPMAPRGLPVVTYGEGLSLHFNGEEIRVVHYPGGHTDGDSVVYFTGSNVVHTGDLFFNGRFPFVDLDAGGSVRRMAENVASILGEIDAETKIIPGHGPLATMRDLERYHDMLTGVLARVQEALDDGMTVEEMKAGLLLAEWQEWSWPFVDADRFLETVARDLSGR